jgi:REP element-mobilizing transposase RayT
MFLCYYRVPQSLANVLTDLIFSTKNREPLLADQDLRQRTHAYLAAVLKDLRCPALIVGGVANHVHILSQLAKTQSISGVMEHLKGIRLVNSTAGGGSEFRRSGCRTQGDRARLSDCAFALH